jgi:hypothetical protein
MVNKKIIERKKKEINKVLDLHSRPREKMNAPFLLLHGGFFRQNLACNYVLYRSPAWLSANIRVMGHASAAVHASAAKVGQASAVHASVVARIHSGETNYVQVQLWQNLPTLVVNDAMVYQNARPFVFQLDVLLNDLVPDTDERFYAFRCKALLKHAESYRSN